MESDTLSECFNSMLKLWNKTEKQFTTTQLNLLIQVLKVVGYDGEKCKNLNETLVNLLVQRSNEEHFTTSILFGICQSISGPLLGPGVLNNFYTVIYLPTLANYLLPIFFLQTFITRKQCNCTCLQQHSLSLETQREKQSSHPYWV